MSAQDTQARLAEISKIRDYVARDVLDGFVWHLDAVFIEDPLNVCQPRFPVRWVQADDGAGVEAGSDSIVHTAWGY